MSELFGVDKSGISRHLKNFSEKQIRQLERAVTGYFDYIEDLIERENVFTMDEFEKSVNAFLEFRQYKLFRDNGKISHKQALEKAYGQIGYYYVLHQHLCINTIVILLLLLKMLRKIKCSILHRVILTMYLIVIFQ